MSQKQKLSGETYVGVAHLELHVPEARHQDLQQRSRLAICALSTSSVDIEARLRRVERTVDRNWSGHVLSWEIEIVQI